MDAGRGAANACKICGGEGLEAVAHTARCDRCGVLLYYPYPPDPGTILTDSAEEARAYYLRWYERSAFFSHRNFTEVLRFTIPPERTSESLRLLDFGGGGGQFALVASSHLPHASIWIVDKEDESVLPGWRCLNRSIPFESFGEDETRFDYIFLNDVFEHLEDPIATLSALRAKLAPDGRIFIDTPRQFWLYLLLRAIPGRSLYKKLLEGTVTKSHLQIWSDEAFAMAVEKAGCVVEKRTEKSALTMGADHYLDNMGIRNGALHTLGRAFYSVARFIAPNKILCLMRVP